MILPHIDNKNSPDAYSYTAHLETWILDPMSNLMILYIFIAIQILKDIYCKKFLFLQFI